MKTKIVLSLHSVEPAKPLNNAQIGRSFYFYSVFYRTLYALAKKLEPEYGSGFSVRQLERSRQFYKMYPIATALRTQFNWTQYKLLIAIPDDYKREYYELEAVNNAWTKRELERQINSQLTRSAKNSSSSMSILFPTQEQLTKEIERLRRLTDRENL